MTWLVRQQTSDEGTIVYVVKQREGRFSGLLDKLSPRNEQEVGRVAKERDDSVNRDRSYRAQLDIVVERARQVAAVKNNWHK